MKALAKFWGKRNVINVISQFSFLVSSAIVWHKQMSMSSTPKYAAHRHRSRERFVFLSLPPSTFRATILADWNIWLQSFLEAKQKVPFCHFFYFKKFCFWLFLKKEFFFFPVQSWPTFHHLFPHATRRLRTDFRFRNRHWTLWRIAQRTHWHIHIDTWRFHVYWMLLLCIWHMSVMGF